MSDRPTHALIVRPLVVEFSLWAAWQLARLTEVCREPFAAAASAARGMDPERRLRAVAKFLTSLLIVLTAVIAYLLLTR